MGSLDGRRPHKLPGVVGSYICDSSFYQGITGLGSPRVNKQLHSRSIYQSYGRNKVIEGLLHDKESLGLMSSVTPNHSCISHPRKTECGSGPVIKVNCGPSQLDAGSNSVSSNQFSLGSSAGGLVCIQDNQTATTFLQLETRPTSEAVDAFKQTWIEFTGYANPPWGLIGCCVQYTLQQGARIVLITPLWPGQPWYPILFPLLLDNPRLLPLSPDLLTSPQALKIPLPERANQLHGTSQAIVPRYRNLR